MTRQGFWFVLKGYARATGRRCQDHAAHAPSFLRVAQAGRRCAEAQSAADAGAQRAVQHPHLLGVFHRAGPAAQPEKGPISPSL